MLHPNYAYLLRFLAQHPGPVLDYGCGRGEVVVAGLQQGLDIAGADVFYAGSTAACQAQASGVWGTRILPIEGGRLPFPDGYFAAVASNQVLEHVADLEAVVSDIARVLRPGGRTLHLFPSAEVWREGHNGLPFVHWMRPGSGLRDGYALALRTLGLGYVKDARDRRTWTREMLAWMDAYCYYRPLRTILNTFQCHFRWVEGWEEEWFQVRAPRLARWVPRALARGLVRRLAGLVLVGVR